LELPVLCDSNMYTLGTNIYLEGMICIFKATGGHFLQLCTFFFLRMCGVTNMAAYRVNWLAKVTLFTL